MSEREKSADDRLLQLINGYRVTQAIHVVARLGIADRLKSGPQASDELAAATNSDPSALYRVLRALASVGVFREDDNRRFSLTEVGHGLTSDAQRSRNAWAQLVGRSSVWQAWGHLYDSVQSGRSAFQTVHGKSIWEFRAENAAEGRIFDLAMNEGSRRTADDIVAACDFGRFGHITDVGGGDGSLLAHLLVRFGKLRGTLFDQAHVLSAGMTTMREAGVADRCTLVAGSFFDGIPSGADAYILKFILHDWDDDRALAILRSCRAAMGGEARLLVIERMLSSSKRRSRRQVFGSANAGQHGRQGAN